MSAQDPDYASEDIRPVVRTAGAGNWGLYIFIAILLIGGFWLFSVMSANREAASAPRTSVAGSSNERIVAPPPLNLPPAPEPTVVLQPVIPAAPAFQYPEPPAGPPQSYEPPAYVPPPPAPPAFEFEEPEGPAVVFEPPPRGAADRDDALEQPSADRVTAGRLANPSMTVPQGTIIPAVLETALDSTRAGGVRALVQRDVRGFDGSRVLINRGSSLYGTYQAGLAPGEKRALVNWTRLIRPDGVTIALNSPSSDPLGRAGIEGDVDSKFFARFGGAILQSVLDIGVGVATQQAGDGVIVAMPGSTQTIQGQQSQIPQPVLEVDHGTSVSVFVARDLDFSSVED